jgi:hypothetical protein
VYLSIGNANSASGVSNNFTGTIDLSSNPLLELCWVDNTNIATLNIKNDNNVNMSNSYFNSSNTPNLTCIIVDDPSYSNTTWTNVDNYSTFIESEAACSVLEAQKPALIALYNATDGDNWTNNTNWNSSNPINSWFGVTVNENGLVTSLDLIANNLAGVIPSEIGDINELEILHFFGNNLTGEIPSEIWGLTKLTQLWLGSQASSSSYEPGTLTLSDGIPASISNLQDLEWLNLNGIYLEQPLQSELFELPVLNRLRLQDCGITGTLPSEFSTIYDLRADRNEFEGAIPSEIITSSGNALLALTGNFFNFADLEDLVLAGNITTLQYSPQRTRDEEDNEAYVPGTDVTLTIDEGAGTKETSDDNDYQWYKDDVAIAEANEDTYTIYNAQTTDSGVYYCIITNPSLPDLEIISANTNLTIDPSASITEDMVNRVIVYPNPSNRIVNVKMIDDTTIKCIELFDSTGRQLLNTSSSSFSIESLVEGIYTMIISNDKNDKISIRIIKE